MQVSDFGGKHADSVLIGQMNRLDLVSFNNEHRAIRSGCRETDAAANHWNGKFRSAVKIFRGFPAAAYGNRFASLDSEDLSHERAFPSKPTRKPNQRRQKTSPTPPDSTDLHREQTVTSQNQVRARDEGAN